jgi:hypothetical protein
MIKLLASFLFTVSLLLPSFPAQASDQPFQPGEKLTFLLRWGIIPAGEAVLMVAPPEEINGETAFHFVLTAESNSFLDLFYKVRDRIDAYTDIEITRSLLYKNKQREGRTKRNIVVNFDWANNQVQYMNGKKKKPPVDLLPGAFDPLSIFYYLRSLDLENISVVERPVSDGTKCVIGRGKIIKKETVTVPAGTYDTLLIEPDLKDVGGVFEKDKNANIHIWVTADAHHIPVKIKSKVAVGSFVGELTKAVLSPPEPMPTANEKQ